MIISIEQKCGERIKNDSIKKEKREAFLISAFSV